ncbi:MAG TPA: hypothetical protein VGN37_00910 [Actinocatenispora sp.]
MTYPPPPMGMPPAPPAPAGRPTTVTAAVGAMMAAVVVSLVSVAVSVVAMPKIVDGFDNMAGAADTGTMKSIFKFSQVFSIVLYLLVAILIVFLAIGNLRGKQGTRIATWVVSGLFLLCGVCGTLSTLSGAGYTSGTSTGDIYNAIPWYRPVSLVVTLLLLLTHGAVILLLALKPSNEFFQRNKVAKQAAQTYPPQYPGAY